MKKLGVVLASTMMVACGAEFDSAMLEESLDSLSESAAIVSPYDYSQMSHVSNATNIGNNSWNDLTLYDWNGDGVLDRAVCNGNANPTIWVVNGANGKTFTNSVMNLSITSGSYTRKITHCEIENIKDPNGVKKPIIVASAMYYCPSCSYPRVGSQQYYLYRDAKNVWKKGAIYLTNRGKDYNATARGVSCDRKGDKDVYCFFGAYSSSNRSGDPTNSTIVKFSVNSSLNIVAEDKPFAPFTGGANGTYGSAFINDGGYSSPPQCNGMTCCTVCFMDGAWVNFNGNSSRDLVTVGRHQFMRVHLDWNGTSFASYRVLNQYNDFNGLHIDNTNFVNSFDNVEWNIQEPCVWVSDDSANDVLLCMNEYGNFTLRNPGLNFKSYRNHDNIPHTGNKRIGAKVKKDGNDLTIRVLDANCGGKSYCERVFNVPGDN